MKTYKIFLELTSKKDVLFIIGDWNAKVGSQETPGVTGKFGLRIRNEAGQRPIEFCQENALVIANTLFQQHKRRLYTWTSSDSQHQNQIDYILCSQRWRSSIQSAIEIYIKLNAPTLVHTSMCFHKYGGGLVTMSDFCDSMDCSLPGFSVHGISQARILERVATSFSRGSSWSRIKPVSLVWQADSLLLSRLYYHNLN